MPTTRDKSKVSPGHAKPAVAQPAALSADEVEELRRERDMLRQKLGRAESRLALFRDISGALTEFMRPEEIIRRLVPSIREVMEAEAAAIFLVEDDRQYLATWVRDENVRREIRVRMGEGIAGWVAQNGNSVNIKDAYRDVRFESRFDEATGFKTSSVMCQPLRDPTSRVIGVVQVLNKRGDEYFTVDDEYTLSTVNALVSVVLQCNGLYMKLIDRQMQLEEREDELRSSLNHLNFVYDMQRATSDAHDAEDIVGVVAERMARTFSCSAVSVFLRQDGLQPQEFTWRLSADSAGLVKASHNWDISYRDAVMESGRHRVINSPSLNTAAACADGVPAAGQTIQSLLAVPLADGDRVFGTLELLNRRLPISDPNSPPRRPFSNEDVKVIQVIASDIGALIARSLAERRARMDEQLAAMGRMMSGVIHDLKSPLGVASGYVQLMVRSDDRAKREEWANSVRKQFEHITRMSQELLAYARGETQVFLRVVHMHAFADEMREHLRHEMEPVGVNVSVEAEYRGDARFDDGKLKRVLFNLARNAREAMSQTGGEYKVVFSAEGDMLVIRCSDTGPGIDPSIQERIFEAFVTKGKKGNSGLGLAIVKKMVDDHNGTVRFSSIPGKGTSFEIRIPLQPEQVVTEDLVSVGA